MGGHGQGDPSGVGLAGLPAVHVHRARYPPFVFEVSVFCQSILRHALRSVLLAVEASRIANQTAYNMFVGAIRPQAPTLSFSVGSIRTWESDRGQLGSDLMDPVFITC